MAEQIEQDEYGVLINRPILIKHVYTNDGSNLKSQPSIGVYCEYTADELFEFSHDYIVYNKPLFSSFYTFYHEMSEGLYKYVEKPPKPVIKNESPSREPDEPYLEAEKDKKIVH